MTISPELQSSFAINAEKIGVNNPFEIAGEIIGEIQEQLLEISLEDAEFPFIENPLTISTQSNPVTGPNTLNLPGIDQNIMSQSQAAGQFSNLTMDQKIRLLFPNG